MQRPNEYQLTGIVPIKNLINLEDVEKFKKILTSRTPDLESEVNVCLFHSLKAHLSLNNFYKYNISMYLRNVLDSIHARKIANSSKFIAIANEFGLNKLSRIDGYISRIHQDPITDWHCDQSFGGATHPGEFFGRATGLVSTTPVNRLFIYLTNVEYDNGAFAYIPGSHRVNQSLRRLINNGVIKYSPFYLLSDGVDLVLKHKKIMTDLTSEELDLFVENANEAIKSRKRFTLPARVGDAILFNDLGYHQGGAPVRGHRMVMRYWY